MSLCSEVFILASACHSKVGKRRDEEREERERGGQSEDRNKDLTKNATQSLVDVRNLSCLILIKYCVLMSAISVLASTQ